MHDLLYAPAVAEKELKERFPEAKTSDASDDIHVERFEVDLPDFQRRDYLKWLLTSGWAQLSFHVQLSIQIPGKQQEEIKEILDEVKAAK